MSTLLPLPLPLSPFLPTIAWFLRFAMPAWVLMSAMAMAIYAGCKWLTYREATAARGAMADHRRAAAYLLAWPGMDAHAFLFDHGTPAAKPSAAEWAAASVKTVGGVAMTWAIARIALPAHPIVAGWLGMIGLIFVLHFGTFHLLSLAWRRVGVQAPPIMRNPLRSTSLAEFWGRRWNTAFHELASRYGFQPLRRVTGAAGASLLVFALSGLVHELVISIPARGGYGLPTVYFLLQGLGLIAERSESGRRLGLGRGPRGRMFTMLVTAGPVCWLFPAPFITNVILPMLAAIGAS